MARPLNRPDFRESPSGPVPPALAAGRLPEWLRSFRGGLATLGMLALLAPWTSRADLFHRGQEIYVAQCVECHGARGEGVADRYDETLFGNRSVESLARLIERTMPEEAPEDCVGDDALAVATYIHAAFYSPEARARLQPVRMELSRLTVRQHQETLADLVGSFIPVRQAQETGGLVAEYYNSEGMNKKHRKVLDRTDPRIDFDFGAGPPVRGMDPEQFSIAWNGSLKIHGTGEYAFRLSTPNGARLYLNTELGAGDSNRRDDSGARRSDRLIDMWVSSGHDWREEVATVFLLGGRTYPIRLDYFKFKERSGGIRLEWRPPHGVWSVIPEEMLSPQPSTPTHVVTTPFPPDDRSAGYERGTAVSKGWQEAVTRAALETADAVVRQLNVLAGVKENAPDRMERVREFCETFVGRAFRRPLTGVERAEAVDAYFVEGRSLEASVKRVVLAALTSPRFLYPELDPVEDDWKTASRLALSLWDSLPDGSLRDAAARGGLSDEGRIREHASRMVEDVRARTKLLAFFEDWLVMDEAEDVSKDTLAFPGFDEHLMADLRASLDLFLEHVVWGDRSDYRELLTSDVLFLNERLARFYGVEGIEGDEFLAKRFDPEERAGLLTHPFLLSVLSYHRSTSPIHRGVFLTRNVMGRFLKPPPMAIEFMDDRFDPTLTMREKVTELTSKPNCLSCHEIINPLGFSLERYDAVGRIQWMDNGKPVDPVSQYRTTDGDDVTLTGPRDVAGLAVESPEAMRGFVRQLFQHMVKQAPEAFGADTLGRLQGHFEQDGFHVRRLMLEMGVTSARGQTIATERASL